VESEGIWYGSESIPLYLIHEGTPAPVVLRSILRTYPQIARVTTATMHVDSDDAPVRFKDTVVRHATEGNLRKKSEHLRGVEGWNRNTLALGLLSRVRLRRNETAHIPMMRFFGNDPGPIGERIFQEFPGFVFDDGVEGFRPVHYFLGATIMPWDRWHRFLGICEAMPGADTAFVRRALRDGTGVVRLFSTERKSISPQVVAMHVG